MQKFSDTVSTLDGSNVVVLSTATVNVYVAGTNTLATIYSDNGVTGKANPFQTSTTGVLEFYAADGRYDLVITKAGYTGVTLSDVLLEDPSDQTDDDLSGIGIDDCANCK